MMLCVEEKNMANYRMNFWNYVPLGDIDANQAVNDWEKLGMNVPTSFRFDPKKHSKDDFIAFLDLCQEKGMKVIVDDARTDFRSYLQKGYVYSEEEYRRGIQDAVNDFGAHPAVFGFSIGDEPWNCWNIAIFGMKTCNELAPRLMHYVNLLPYWKNDDDPNNDCLFEATGCRTPSEYSEAVSKFIVASGAKLISYDCYAQCSYFNKEKYIDRYFLNLKIIGDAARRNGVELWTSLLSVAHMSLRPPTEDDIRYQISTAVASGAVGLSWFFMYERNWDYSFRSAPFDLFYEKTQTYEYLSRQTRTFMQVFAPKLKDCKFVWAKHFKKAYGGFEELTFDDEIVRIEYLENEEPLIITKFEKENGEPLFAVTNNSNCNPTYVKITFGVGKHAGKTQGVWYAPGQMLLW